VLGVDRFSASAPAPTMVKNMAFTVENVVAKKLKALPIELRCSLLKRALGGCNHMSEFDNVKCSA